MTKSTGRSAAALCSLHSFFSETEYRNFLSVLYRFAWGVVRLLSPLLSIGSSNLARGLSGRRRAHDLLSLWGRTLKDPDRPVVWVHAPSVGEGFQARAVIRELRALRPDVQVVYTFFSPSAEEIARSINADVATYLPWDLKGPLGCALEEVAPDAVIFTKTEIWPTLVNEADRRGIPVGMIGAVVTRGSGRMGLLAKMFMKPSWNALSLACANSEEDALALQSLGVSPRAVKTTGDPGIDSAVYRFRGRDLQHRWHALLQADARPTVVAGSTWVSDEDVLLPALVSTRERVTDLRLIVAPHKPSELAVAKLIERLKNDGWWATTLSKLEDALAVEELEVSLRPNAIVVDRVGVLANLYGLASVSFVGGGFHGRGLHSVLEPAAAESGVLFGSQHHRARAAGDLISCGGAVAVQNVEELTEVITTWLTDEARRKAAGAASAEYIHSNRGAALRSATLLESLLRVK